MIVGVSIVIFIVLLGAQIFLRSFVCRYRKEIVYITIAFYVFSLSIQTWIQYSAWNQSELTQFLLPPHSSIEYFGTYVFFRIWAPYLISFLFALLLLMGMKWGNKKKEGKLFFDEELSVAFIAMLGVGYPTLIPFSLLFLFVYVGILLFQGKNKRFSSYFLWLPVALCAILVSEYIFEGANMWALLSI